MSKGAAVNTKSINSETRYEAYVPTNKNHRTGQQTSPELCTRDSFVKDKVIIKFPTVRQVIFVLLGSLVFDK